MDHLAAVFPQYYFPSRYISIDEMMVGTRCHVVFLQYLPKKPTKFGMKVWVNSEAKSGYVLNFQIYTGSESKAKEKGLGYRVVMDLMEPYFHKGHCLFIDNYYTSVKLLIDLLAKGTYCAGTARSNRKYFPTEIIPSKGTESTDIQPGSFRFAVGKEKDSSLQDTSSTSGKDKGGSGLPDTQDKSFTSGKDKGGSGLPDTQDKSSTSGKDKGGSGLPDTQDKSSTSGKDKGSSGLPDTQDKSSTSGEDKHCSNQDSTSGNSIDHCSGGKIVAVWWRDR